MLVERTRSGGEACPPWCVESHEPDRAAEDRVHIGEPVYISGPVTARLCMAVDEEGRLSDGPYVLVGDDEYTVDETLALAETLLAMARLASLPRRPWEAR